MAGDITGLHHVGVVTADLADAVGTYRRLGFTISDPTCPVLPASGGGRSELLGAANVHADLGGGFVEIAMVADETSTGLPDSTRTIPIEVPEASRAELLAAARTSTATLAAGLRRFPGLHILMFDSPEVDRAAARLARDGVVHGGVYRAQRPLDTSEGLRMEPVLVVEISGDGGSTPEGRLGIAGNLPAARDRRPEHANGARALVDCLLCIDDAAVGHVEQRYTIYIGRSPDRHGPLRRFTLATAAVTLVPASAVADLRLGALPDALPAFVGYAVEVDDLAATRRFLHRAEFTADTSDFGAAVVVPAEEALGAAVIFRAPRASSSLTA